MKDSLTEGVETQAGKALIIQMNKYYGSVVWGAVLNGVKAIEKEMKELK